MKVEITCEKDPLIEKHCRDAFQEKFDRVLSWDRGKGNPEGELSMFRKTLEKEVRRQQWYDFEIVGACRRVLRDAEGNPQLLVPQIKIVP